MTDERLEEIYNYKKEMYVVDLANNESYERVFEVYDFANDLIKELSGKKNWLEITSEEYDMWLERIYDNFDYAVAYWYREDFEFPDVENAILMEKIRKNF